MEEKEIIEKILKGQTQYFEVLIEKYQKLVYQIFYRSSYFRNSHEIEDLVQETFIRAFDNLSSYNPQYEFRNWIYTIALNLLRKHIRKEKIKINFKKMLFLSFDEVDSRFLEQEPEESKELKNQLSKEIQKLPVHYQKALLLYYGDDMKIKDIAEILKTNENTVKTWLKRAKEKLEDNPFLKKLQKN